MGIGTLNEGPLHAALKAAYAANGGDAEVSVNGFVADAVREGVIYEVQTGSFSGLRRKMESLLADQRVVLVHPIAAKKYIVKQGPDAGPKRLSPKRGKLNHILNELVYLPSLLSHPNFAVEAVMTEEEEIRVFDPKKRRRRGGWRVVERHLVTLGEGMRIEQPDDLFQFIPGDLPAEFSTKHLALAMDESRSLAQKMAYCLRHSGITEVCGKEGNAILYRRL